MLHSPSVAFVVTLVLLGATFVSTPAHAALEAQPARADLGSVKAGEKLTLRFKLRNTGGQAVKIRSVDGDCGCLTPEFPKVLAANGTGELKVKFEPFANWSGKVVKQLTVRPEDRTQPDLTLHVTADIIPFVKVQPRRSLVVPLQPGQVVRQELTLVPRAGSTLRITKAEASSSLVRAVLVPPAAGDRTRTHKLKLTVGPNPQPGDFQTKVTVHTTEPRLAELPIQVRGQATAGPVVIPQKVMLASVRPDEATRPLANLRVFNRSGQLRILSVDTGNPALRAEVQTRQAGQFYSVFIRPAGRLRSGVLASTIRIKTDDRKYPVVTVPFHATVQ